MKANCCTNAQQLRYFLLILRKVEQETVRAKLTHIFELYFYTHLHRANQINSGASLLELFKNAAQPYIYTLQYFSPIMYHVLRKYAYIQ